MQHPTACTAAVIMTHFWPPAVVLLSFLHLFCKSFWGMQHSFYGLYAICVIQTCQNIKRNYKHFSTPTVFIYYHTVDGVASVKLQYFFLHTAKIGHYYYKATGHLSVDITCHSVNIPIT